MLFLILSIIGSAILLLLFKVFERHGLPLFHVIVFNYCTAAVCGFIFLPDRYEVTSGAFVVQGWLAVAIILGMMFIAVFNLTSISAVRFGLSATSVAYKLGLVFPVMFAFMLYHESFNWPQLAGIFLAFVAVILSSLNENAPVGASKSHTCFNFLPYIVFIGSGLCDCVTQFANKRYLMHRGNEEFVMFIFTSAAVTGLVVLIMQLITGKLKLNPKSIIAGILMGIPNYFSYLFLMKALASPDLKSSVIFPVSNLGVVAIVTAGGILIFKEKISKLNLLGLVFAAIAITFITLSNYK